MNKRTGITYAALAALILIAALTGRILWRNEQTIEPAVSGQLAKEESVDTAAKTPSSPPTHNLISAVPLATKPERASLPARVQGIDESPWPTAEFERVFGLTPGVTTGDDPLQKVHGMFLAQSRDAAWADLMESSISQSLNMTEATAGITVSFLECRSTICEVAGAMPDSMTHPDLDPRNLLSEDFGSGWWQGRIGIGMGSHTYQDEGITRYIMIITDQDLLNSASEDFQKRLRDPANR